MTLKETEEYFTKRILLQYNYDEAKSVSKLALLHILKFNNLEYTLNHNMLLDEEIISTVNFYLNRLVLGEPIQYIIGEANFMGYDFFVTPAVLIPRRETEELVQIIKQENRQNNSQVILDIGTGSGCIAIMLKNFFRAAKVYAIDCSTMALDVASKNAKKMNLDIDFVHADILVVPELAFDEFDIIVSNPPYVTKAEISLMHRNVIDYEPHLALFVEDNDPFVFYKKITQLAAARLKSSGKLYFEVNENYAAEVQNLLLQFNFVNTQIRVDMQGKNRMVSGEIYRQ